MSNENLIYKRQSDTLKNLLSYAQLSINKETSALLGVSLRTLQRYAANDDAPEPIRKHLLSIIGGFPQTGKWNGFHITNDYLITPYNQYISVKDLLTLHDFMIMANAREGEIKELKARISELEQTNAGQMLELGKQLVEMAQMRIAS